MTMNKAFKGSINDFWDTDTYTSYSLLSWTNEVLEMRADMAENPDKYRKPSNKYGIEEDPETLDVFNKITGRDLEDD